MGFFGFLALWRQDRGGDCSGGDASQDRGFLHHLHGFLRVITIEGWSTMTYTRVRAAGELTGAIVAGGATGEVPGEPSITRKTEFLTDQSGFL